MPLLSASDAKNQAELRQILLDEKNASKLENLAAALLGYMLDVPIAVAKSGFQYGGDAGPAGRQGRRFRIECKKYGESTNLSNRELLGEIDHALSRDEALEAWFLITTRSVSEQLELDLTQKGESLGVPVIILDWKDSGLSALAALCASEPSIVEEVFSPEAGTIARLLQPAATATIRQIKRNLDSWTLGFDGVREKSHLRLESIWNSPRASSAELGQNVAGGTVSKRIRRTQAYKALCNWWNDPVEADAPAAVVGWDGVGKTWGVLDWLFDQRCGQPILLIVASSTAADLKGVSETSVKQFLADRLYELGGTRDRAHWLHRLDRLLLRPAAEGPIMTIFFDGLNQELSVPWLQLIKVFQGPVFEGKVRVVVSTRTHHFENKLSKFHGLVVPAMVTHVDLYDADPGGELDQMLAFEGLKQTDMHSDLIDLARTPRLFKLVVMLHERFLEAGQITIHRLLWEYGRDTFGERAGHSFSPTEWQDWLSEIAGTYREGIRDYSVKELGETASRADLTEAEVYARLSDIIDGRFVDPGPSGKLHLTPTVVSHALGVALLSQLSSTKTQTFEAVDADLTRWLDPIAGLDQRAEILRAAVSILVARGEPTSTPVAGVLVTAWLQSQNITDQHRSELAALADSLVDPLLDTVERSCTSVNASARLWAISALKALSRSDSGALELMTKRAKDWHCIVPRHVNSRPDADAGAEKRRAQRFIDRVGVDASGPLTVLGLSLQFIDGGNRVLGETAASILEGYPLVRAIPVFEAAAVSFAVAGRNDGWGALKWLCLLNQRDPEETAAALRTLSETVLLRPTEAGVNPDLRGRVSALLLWLTGFESDDVVANKIDPRIDFPFSYEKDYLENPGQSIYRLERRHAKNALLDKDVSFFRRIQRTTELWLDPTFDPPSAFVEEVRAKAVDIDIEKLNLGNGSTVEDHYFEQFKPVLARCAPDLLTEITKHMLRNLKNCPIDSRYWRSIGATEHFILLDDPGREAARVLRDMPSDGDGDEDDETLVRNKLLILEVRDLSAKEQMAMLIEANLEFILLDFDAVLKVPSLVHVDDLFSRFGNGTPKQQRDLLTLLSVNPVTFSDQVWNWIEKFARSPEDESLHLAFQTLARADSVRFGKTLLAWDWSWSSDHHFWVNHYGSDALIDATLSIPFDQVAGRLAPWRLLEAVGRRGIDPTDVRLAAEIFGHALAAEKLEEPDAGASLSINRTKGHKDPYLPSIQPRPSTEGGEDPAAAFKAAMDLDAQRETQKRAQRTAVRRIREARCSGASLYLSEVSASDLKAVIEHASDLVDRWLEGMSERTMDFRRRVRLAEIVYLSLCEELFAHDPERAAVLWYSLRETITTRYVGAAGVGELLHILFRVPDSPAVTVVRDEVFGLECSNTDEALRKWAIAATFNGKSDWLTSQIADDQASRFAWRQRRSIVLSGFISNNELPIVGAWPGGEMPSSHAELRLNAAQLRSVEACASHWWHAYLNAKDATKAYAAWVLFVQSADNRCHVWSDEDKRAADDGGEFSWLKMAHVRLNRHELKRKIDKREKKIDTTFLGRRIENSVNPWAKYSS